MDPETPAASLDPDSPQFLGMVGSAFASAGDYEQAAQFLRRAVDADPLFVIGWSELARLPDHELTPGEIEHIRSIPDRVDLDAERRAAWASALGVYYQRAGDVDQAWAWIEEMNAALRISRPSRRESEDLFLRDVFEHLDRAYFDNAAQWSTGSHVPIFIFGLPRSGTTLLEQILGSHGKVRAGGEMHTMIELGVHVYRAGDRTGSYVRSLAGLDATTWHELQSMARDAYVGGAGSAARLTDKMPSNYRHFGLMAALLPDAKYISIRRNPMDVAVSNYTQMYGKEHGWSSSPNGLAQGWADHRDLMNHWRQHAPVDVHEVRYEELVAEPRPQIERLLEFCELDWDDRCMEFHRQPGIVATASRYQVRQPIYRSAVGAWRRFERHVDPIRDALVAVGAPIV
ncbi:MAG: sulfotransferase [Actinomycetota bacterium]